MGPSRHRDRVPERCPLTSLSRGTQHSHSGDSVRAQRHKDCTCTVHLPERYLSDVVAQAPRGRRQGKSCGCDKRAPSLACGLRQGRQSSASHQRRVATPGVATSAGRGAIAPRVGPHSVCASRAPSIRPAPLHMRVRVRQLCQIDAHHTFFITKQSKTLNRNY